MDVTTRNTLGGLDLTERSWGETPHSDPAIQAWRLAMERKQVHDLDRLAQALPDTPTAKRGATRLLLNHFSTQGAEALRAARNLDETLLLEEAMLHYPLALGWICQDAEGVKRAEANANDTIDRVDDKRKSKSQQKHLGICLSELGTRMPNDTLACLLTMDLVTTFRNHNTLDSWSPWCHGGMKVLTSILTSEHPVDETLLRVAVEKMLSPAVLISALGKQHANDPQIQACQLDPLVWGAVGNSYHPENMKALGRLERLAQQSSRVAALLNIYWAMDTAPGKTAGVQIAHSQISPDPNRISRILKGGTRAHNLVDCLVMGGRKIVKEALNEGNPNAVIFWKALERGGNLHNYLRTCSSSEIVQLLPELMEHLGETWRDDAGNNLAHVVALATAAPEKQALMTLTRLPRGSLLFTRGNHEGITPLMVTETDPKWKSDAPDFHKRLSEQVARARKKDLVRIQKEAGPRPRTHAPGRSL